MIDLTKLSEISSLSIVKKREFIKSDPELKELFTKKLGVSLTTAKKIDFDNFFDSLKQELETKNKQEQTNNSELISQLPQQNNLQEQELKVNSQAEELKQEVINQGDETKQDQHDKREIPERIVKKIITDLYPNINNKRKLIQNDRVLLMAFRLSKKDLQKASNDEIDEFLYNYCKTKDKFLQQLTIAWLNNKRKIVNKLQNINDLTEELLNDLLTNNEDITIEDIETYCYINNDKFSASAFNLIESRLRTKPQTINENEDLKNESLSQINEDIKEDKEKFDKLRKFYEQEKNALKEEIIELKRKHEQEKVQIRQEITKEYKTRIEKLREEFTEEKNQLLRQAQLRENKLREEKTIIEKELNENKTLVNEIKKELAVKSSEIAKAQSRISNLEKRNEELQKKLQQQLEDFTSQIEELQDELEAYKIEQAIYLEDKLIHDQLLRQLLENISDIENLKMASLLKTDEIIAIIKELNATDHEKEKIYHLLNNTEVINNKTLNDNLDLLTLWQTLIDNENKVITDYLKILVKNIDKENFIDILQSIADIKYSLKAREILLQIIYEKGHKAYNFIKS